MCCDGQGMSSPEPEIEVVHRPERTRYEIVLGGEPIGFTSYRDQGDRRVFLHTEVDAAYEGRGYGRRLAGAALDSTREAGMTVMPRCPFIAAFIKRNRAYADLVAVDG
jgi:predicted GNAT family acetyltransferase